MRGELQDRITVAIDRPMRNEIHAWCSKNKIKQSELVRLALDEYLKNHPMFDVDSTKKRV